jgi:hypothetical protein
MSRRSREKGKDGEREVAKILSEQLGLVVRRKLGQARDGGHDLTQTGRFAWEVKRRKGIAVHEWVEQCVAACGPHDTPVVACRGDGKEWLVVMRLEDALPLIRGELGPMEP